MKKINKNSAIPFHIQIKEEIIKFAKSNDSTKSLPHHEELARIFGTSRFTVAKAVSELKKEKILKAVKGRGTFLTGQKSKVNNFAVIEKNKIITLILPTGENSPIFQGCQSEAENAGYHLFLKNTELLEDKTRENFIKREREFLIKYKNGELGDSLILYYEGGRENLDILKSIVESGKPIVCIDRLPYDLPVNYVGYDNFNAGRMITERFINMGKSNIAIVGTGAAISSTQEQVSGYIKALEENGLEVNKQNILTEVDFIYYWKDAELEHLKKRFLEIKDSVDAVYFMSAHAEQVVLSNLSGTDLNTDIVFAGSMSVEHPWIREKYVAQRQCPSVQLGVEAVKLVISKLSSENRMKIEQIRLPIALPEINR